MDFWELGVRNIKELESEHGILASSRHERYACIFGRDSLITSLMLLYAHRKKSEPYFLCLVEKILRNLALLQGTEVNLESGEEPGKMIHEWRPTGHEHLTTMSNAPWFLYPDNILRNYDTADATSLFLITAHEYRSLVEDDSLTRQIEPNIRAALEWLVRYGDSNGDGLLDYRFHPDRKYGGLRTQSWMDSTESVFFEHTDERPKYPIAPVEVQAYAFSALMRWSDFFAPSDPAYAASLEDRARNLKRRFNETFVLSHSGSAKLAFAIDGEGKKLTAPRSSMGHVLWALGKKNGTHESILDERYVPHIAQRLLRKDMFVPRAGVRTLSSRSKRYDPCSYHNGSIWPHDTAIAAIGLEQFGFTEEASRVRQALKSAYRHFNTPIELFGYSRGTFREYKDPDGSLAACRTQAWSAAALLSVE